MNRPATFKLKTPPRPHQVEAVIAAKRELAEISRTTVTMACGTGKTLLEPMLAQILKSNRVLVAAPSISLVKQTLDVWLREGVVTSETACVVCSDETAGEGVDAIHTSDIEETGIPTTTREEELRKLVTRRARQVIFSTYQSLPVLARALPRGYRIELAFFDEAHRTAQPDTTLFGFGLSDANLPIDQRVFLTATPKILSARRAGDSPRVVVSMDNEDLYGRIAYALTFDQAMAAKLIAEYQVLVSAITKAQVDAALLRRGDIVRGRDRFRLDEIAGQIALAKSMDTTGARKAITFHHTVRRAQQFSMDVVGILAEAGVHCFHVNGEMAATERARIIDAYDRHRGRAVLTNARCLTEGVDVPHTDIVGFMYPKQSEVDVVQALGRALRKTPSKKVAYALVPLLIDSDQPFNRALADSRYGALWDVLAAIESGHLITGTPGRRQRGLSGPQSVQRKPRVLKRLKVDAEDSVLEQLREAIEVRAVEVLFGRWSMQFEELVKYRAAHGGADPVAKSPLGSWLQTQRRLYKSGRLQSERLEQLVEAGISFGPLDDLWEEQYNKLAKFARKHGHCRVPVRSELGQWVVTQRHSMRFDRISEERKRRLRTLGFVDNVHEERWNARFQELVQYKRQNGTLMVSFKKSGRLAQWCRQQRERSEKGTLTDDQRKQLLKLGFDFAPESAREAHEKVFERNLEAIAKLRANDAQAAIPKMLAKWASNAKASALRRGDETGRLRAAMVVGALEGRLPGAD